MFLCELLPHKPNAELSDLPNKIKHLSVMSVVLDDALEAVSCFLEGQLYPHFDAHVGETLCQIRAYRNLIYFRNLYSETEHRGLRKFLSMLENSKKCLHDVYFHHVNFVNLKKSARPSYLNKSITLEKLISDERLVYIDDGKCFLIFSYMLAKYAVRDNGGITVAIDYKRVCENYDISRNYCKKMVHYYQKTLAKLSTQFILGLSKELYIDGEYDLHVSKLARKSEEDRLVLSCYHSTEVILLHALQKKVKVALNIFIESEGRYATYIFEPKITAIEFSLVEDYTSLYNEGLLVFEGTSDYGTADILLKKLLCIGLVDVILSHQAKHPQYSGKVLSDFRANPFLGLSYCPDNHNGLYTYKIMQRRFSYYLNLANRHRFGNLTKGSALLIKHIYASTVERLSLKSSLRILNETKESINS